MIGTSGSESSDSKASQVVPLAKAPKEGTHLKTTLWIVYYSYRTASFDNHSLNSVSPGFISILPDTADEPFATITFSKTPRCLILISLVESRGKRFICFLLPRFAFF
jgi:hypothetical protein